MNTTRRRRRGLAAVAATAVLAIVAACSPTAPDGNGASPTPDETTTQPSGEARELRLSIGATPHGLGVTSLALSRDAYIWTALYDQLLVLNNEGMPEPSAATAWEFSDDALTLTFTLRDDLVFTNGDRATAEDAAATWLFMKDNPGTHQALFQLVTSIEALDDTTLQVTFSEPDVNFLYAIARIGVIAHRDHLDDPDSATNPIGSGVYELDMAASVPGSLWVLNRRDDHWNAASFDFSRVTVTVIEDDTAQENALRSGQIDVASIQTGSLAPFQDGNFNITTIDGTTTLFLMIPDRAGEIVPALADVRVRQAINYAFDRDALVQAIGQGSGLATTQLMIPGTDAFVPELNDRYEFNVERARELMAEAGYPDGFDVTMFSNPFLQHFDPIFAQVLGDIGIRVSWDQVSPADIGTATVSGDYPMVVSIEGSSSPTNLVIMNYLADSRNNVMGTTDPELDVLLEQFRNTMDEAARNEIIAEINTFMVENAWDAPIMHFSENFVMSPGVNYIGNALNNISSVRLFEATTE